MSTTTKDGNGIRKKVVLQLKLSQVRRDGGTQSRAEVKSDTINQYAEALQEGAVFPPVVVFHDGTHYWLASGFHRWHAHEIAKRKTLDCDVREGTLRDAILFSVGCNHQHGLQRSNEDKRYACRLILSDEEWWDKTDKWIADKVHVSPHTVAGVREDMEAEWAEEEEKRKKKEAEQAATTKAGESSTSGAHVENGSTQGARHEKGQRRVGRSRHGGTRTLTTGNQGGKKGVKPIYVEKPGTKKYFKLEKQEVRSSRKWLRQWKALGRDRDAAHAEIDRLWDEIPVAE